MSSMRQTLFRTVIGLRVTTRGVHPDGPPPGISGDRLQGEVRVELIQTIPTHATNQATRDGRISLYDQFTEGFATADSRTARATLDGLSAV
jgi:hypothetical protein